MYDFLQKYIAMKSTKLLRSEYPQSANAKIGLNLSIPIALIIKHLNYFDFQSYSKWMWITSPHPKNTNPANSSRGRRFCCTFSSSWNETKIIEKKTFIYFCSYELLMDINITLVFFVTWLKIVKYLSEFSFDVTKMTITCFFSLLRNMYIWRHIETVLIIVAYTMNLGVHIYITSCCTQRCLGFLIF